VSLAFWRQPSGVAAGDFPAGSTRSALFAKPDIAVEAWPKAARGDLARVGIGRVRSYENLATLV